MPPATPPLTRVCPPNKHRITSRFPKQRLLVPLFVSHATEGVKRKVRLEIVRGANLGLQLCSITAGTESLIKCYCWC